MPTQKKRTRRKPTGRLIDVAPVEVKGEKIVPISSPAAEAVVLLPAVMYLVSILQFSAESISDVLKDEVAAVAQAILKANLAHGISHPSRSNT